ncbi:hypothetical protein Tco_0548419 [Tanacetum coccineum]
MMSFLTAIVTSRYPTTNNQLRNSSNPRQQATINDGRVIIQPVQGRQISYAAGTTRTFTPGASGNNSGKQRIVTCYNCKGEGGNVATVEQEVAATVESMEKAARYTPNKYVEAALNSETVVLPYLVPKTDIKPKGTKEKSKSNKAKHGRKGQVKSEVLKIIQ